jgi:hypothetical protein
MDKQKLIENVIKEAKRDLLKEYSLIEKAELSSLIKLLVSSGVDEKELKTLTDFYRYDNEFEEEDELIYAEFKNKLLDLAAKNNINVPEKFQA